MIFLKKLLKILLSRTVIVGLLILLQLFVLIGTIYNLSSNYVYVYLFFTILSYAVVLWIMSKKDNPSYKLGWILPVLVFPIFGGFFYLIFGTNRINKKFIASLKNIQFQLKKSYHNDSINHDEIDSLNKNIHRQLDYIKNTSDYPVHKNTETKYLPIGEKMHKLLLEELEKAEKFIFLEFFIIGEGVMWDSILEILERKASQGVDVRVMYDDIGSLKVLPYKYYKTLEKKGIKSVAFNPFVPRLNIQMNNRDHRKIVVIDGNVGFTGGINISDEYINQKVRFGHWKDCGIMIKGDAVWNLTLLFLETWTYYKGFDKDINNFKPTIKCQSDGYVLPFGDCPHDENNITENAYLQIINNATDYVYINTPYLVIDNEMLTALELAAKSGVDVRIVTPHIPDKWYVHLVTQGVYKQLIESGVKIYEYTPGFIHSKTFVSDDNIGIIGTCNMDFRSFYLHFENGIWLYKSKALLELKEDYLETLKKCHEITLEDCKKISLGKKFLRAILKNFAPLM